MVTAPTKKARTTTTAKPSKAKTKPESTTLGAIQNKPTKTLEYFNNPYPSRDFRVHMEIPEFTCLCPKTGQPDFATITIDYIADKRCVELKSLKLYMWSYRDQGAFHEAVTNQILDDLVQVLQPRFLRVSAKFNVRGGIHTTIRAEHRREGWIPQPSIPLHDSRAS